MKYKLYKYNDKNEKVPMERLIIEVYLSETF